MLDFFFLFVLFFEKHRQNALRTETNLSDALSGRGNSWPRVGALFGNGPGDGRAFHLALVVYYHARVVLKVRKRPVFSSERFPLPDNHTGNYFLPQVGLSLFDGADDHVT